MYTLPRLFTCTFSSLALLFAVSLHGQSAPHAARAEKNCHYFNQKYSYSIDYPCFLTGLGEPDAHDGQVFTSKTKPMKIRVWGSYSDWSGEDMTIAQELSDSIKNLSNDELPSPKITYKATGKNWFVLSGISKNNIFYHRTIKANGVFATVLVIYPAAQKQTMNTIATRIANSLKI
jgi:hypothetical protein